MRWFVGFYSKISAPGRLVAWPGMPISPGRALYGGSHGGSLRATSTIFCSPFPLPRYATHWAIGQVLGRLLHLDFRELR